MSLTPTALPAGLVEPGVYVSIRTDGDAGLSDTNTRCLLWGYMSPGGTGVPNQPHKALSQEDVDAAFRPYSMLSHAYAAAKAQIPVGAEVWLLPLLEPAGGTAQAVTVEFTGEPTAGVLSSATTAAAADSVWVSYRGRGAWTGIRAGDTWATIAAAVKASLEAVESFPATIGISTAALTFTARHKGAYDDGAVEVSFASRGASGVAAKIGTVTFAGAATVATSGSFTLTMGAKVAQVTVIDTGTAAASGTALVNKLLSDSYPVRAAQPSSPTGTVTLFYVSGRPVRPLAVTGQLSGVTVQTAAVATGTAGGGNPTLTSALQNLAGDDAAVFKAWSLFWTSAGEWSSTATHVEAQEAVPLMKGQVAIGCSTASYATVQAADLPNATTPKLTATSRYSVLWAQSAGNAGWELSARLAAAVAAEADPGRNWNGFTFAGSDAAPIVPIHPADRPSTDERNGAIALRHCPVTVGSSGNMTLTWGGNTYRPRGMTDKKLAKLSARLTLDYMRQTLAAYLSATFAGKSVKAAGQPRTNRAVTPRDVEAAVFRWAKLLDDRDLYDGAEAHRDAIMAGIVVSPTRIDVQIPFALLADLDIIAATGVAQ